MPLGRKWRLARGIAFSLEHAFGLKKYTAKVWNALYLTTLSREINPLRWSDPIELRKGFPEIVPESRHKVRMRSQNQVRIGHLVRSGEYRQPRRVMSGLP